MEKTFKIFSDFTCDLSKEMSDNLDVFIIPMEFILDGKVFTNEGDSFITTKDFYQAMREGKKTSTSQISPAKYIEVFTKFLEEGKDILYIAFSAALSGSINSAFIAKKELNEKFPDRKIEIVSSLAACTGEGLLVYKTAKFAETGKTLEETKTYSENQVQKTIHFFSVDDLGHLHRGGRITKAAAFIGSILQLKPILHVSPDGKLVPVSKVMGRRKSIQALCDSLVKTYDKDNNDIIFISHGDCIEEAKLLGWMITEKTGITNIVYNEIGPVIGAHSGPGTIALFFTGFDRATK